MKLPTYVESKPEFIKRGWTEVYNSSSQHGEEIALIAAHGWLTRQKAEPEFIKRSMVHFEIDTSQGFIKRSLDDNEDYITLILNGTEPHKDGMQFSEAMLQKWADYINKNPIIGDVDHSEYDKLLSSALSDDDVKTYLKSKRGIAKSVKAVFEKGKLWVRALIDKRYKKLIEESKGVSVEAIVKKENNVAVDGDLLGFTFNILTTPADSLAGVVA
jgi:hypothetical protein